MKNGAMSMGRLKPSPSRKAVGAWRPTAVKRPKGRVGTSLALNKATKTLSAVSVDSSTQRGNIKVVVRVRPSNDRETTANSRTVVHSIDSHMVLFDPPDDETDFYFKGVKQTTTYNQRTRNKNLKMAFDNVYGPNSTNVEIFEEVITPMLDTLLNGFNCSVFAYGATGAGKTHTMLGNANHPGLTFQTVMELYRRLGEMESEFETEVAVSYLEVYNETVKDLLHSSGDLNLREDNNGVVVSNLTTHRPKDANELLNLLAFGNSVRSQHPTDHNAESSRSHAVFQVYINLRSRFTEFTNKYKSAKLVMVDLAGSEKGAATGCHGQRFREGASINKSLLSLGNCINALADGKKHIPYRDSKLTRILKDSLGGNCKTVMIANVSPSSLSYDDSYNTLRYADRAKRIKCQVKKNTMSVSACLTQYTKVVEEMSHKIELLQEELADAQRICRCKVPKVDAATEMKEIPPYCQQLPKQEDFEYSNDVLSNHHGPCQSACPALEPSILEKCADLLRAKEDAIRILIHASGVVCRMEAQIAMRRRRMKTIKKLNSGYNNNYGNKVTRQLDVLTTRHWQAKEKKRKALSCLRQLQEQESICMEKVADSNGGCVPLKLSEYNELQQLKVRLQESESLKTFYKKTSEYFMEELIKDETLIEKSVEFFSTQFSLNKHYNHNTKKMEEEYEELVSDICGTRVHFYEDDPDLPELKEIMDEGKLLGIEVNVNKAEASPDEISKAAGAFKRITKFGTPPPKTGLSIAAYDEAFPGDPAEFLPTSNLNIDDVSDSVFSVATETSVTLDRSSKMETPCAVSVVCNYDGDSTFDLEEPQVLNTVESIIHPAIYNSTHGTNLSTVGPKNDHLNTTIELDKGTYDDCLVSSSVLSTASSNVSYGEPVPLFLPPSQFNVDFSAMEADSMEGPADLSQKENQSPLGSRNPNFTVLTKSCNVDTTFDVTFTSRPQDTTFSMGMGPPAGMESSLKKTVLPSSTTGLDYGGTSFKSSGFPIRNAKYNINSRSRSPVTSGSGRKPFLKSTSSSSLQPNKTGGIGGSAHKSALGNKRRWV